MALKKNESVKQPLTRWGIGPKIALPSVLYGAFGACVTYVYPEQLRMSLVPSWVCLACGTSFLVVGIMFYVISLRLLLSNMKRETLTTTGPYRVVRHPIYAAWILCIMPGIALVLRSWILLSTPMVCYTAFRFFVHEEEDLLEAVFGGAYETYRRRTPELIPVGWIREGQRMWKR